MKPTTSIGLARYILDVLAPLQGACIISGNKGAGKTATMQTFAYHILINRQKLAKLGYGNLYVFTTNTYVYVEGDRIEAKYPPYMVYVNDLKTMFQKWADIRREDPHAQFVLMVDEAQKVMGAVRASSSMEYSFLNFVDEARHFGIRLIFATPNLNRILPALRNEAKFLVDKAEEEDPEIKPEDLPVYVTSYIRKFTHYNITRARKYDTHPQNLMDLYYLDTRYKNIRPVHVVMDIPPAPWVTGKEGFRYETHAIDAFGLGTITVETPSGLEKEVPFDIRHFLKFLGGTPSHMLPLKIIRYFNMYGGYEDESESTTLSTADFLRLLFNAGLKPYMREMRLWKILDTDKSYVYRIYREWQQGNVHPEDYVQISVDSG